VSSRIICCVTKNKELDILEKSATSKKVEEPTHIVFVREAGDVGAPVTLDSFTEPVKRRRCKHSPERKER
jgi:hypothetical protein